MTDWIKCKDRLPDADGFYIVVMRGDIIGQYGWFVTSCGFERGKWDEGDIAAWRPFPALPCEYHELWGDTNDDADGWIPCAEHWMPIVAPQPPQGMTKETEEEA